MREPQQEDKSFFPANGNGSWTRSILIDFCCSSLKDSQEWLYISRFVIEKTNDDLFSTNFTKCVQNTTYRMLYSYITRFELGDGVIFERIKVCRDKLGDDKFELSI
jgi:hypothetical protein